MKNFKSQKEKELHLTRPPRLEGRAKNKMMNPVKKKKQSSVHKQLKKMSRSTSMKKTRAR